MAGKKLAICEGSDPQAVKSKVWHYRFNCKTPTQTQLKLGLTNHSTQPTETKHWPSGVSDKHLLTSNNKQSHNHDDKSNNNNNHNGRLK